MRGGTAPGRRFPASPARVPPGTIRLAVGASWLAVAACAAPAVAQDAGTVEARFGARPSATATALPEGDAFLPLLADPKRPGFVASVLWSSSDVRSTEVAAVAFGESFGIVRWGGATRGLQLGLSGGVFAQFDLRTISFDLMNADYVIGLPVTARRGRVSARLRIYHQSSHLGDEYLLRERPDRVNLSFESVEALASATLGPARVYGGGEWIVRHEPEEFGRGLLHLGVEWRPSAPVFRAGRPGAGRLVAAVDGKAWEQHDWAWALSGRAGIEVRPESRGRAGAGPSAGATAPRAPSAGALAPGDGRTWSLLLELYDGPSPYGQFYSEQIRYVGLGIHLNL